MSNDGDFNHVPWSHQASIYEVNLRQHTRQGTLTAFQTDLPRLTAMGVNILWLMPIHPIGVAERKGSLGRYYAASDYVGVNPEFGTLDDLRRVVKTAYALGMKLIIDWVANHTAWDHAWAYQQPAHYKKNTAGEIYPVTFTGGPEPEYWTDFIGLDFTHMPLWAAMIDAMAYWLRDVAKGRADASALAAYVQAPKVVFPAHGYRMNFTSNHDANPWFRHDAEVFGDAFNAIAVLAATLPGVPLILGGQESGLHKRLAFFEKDDTEWGNYLLQGFYTELLAQKAKHPTLGNGQHGAPAEVLETGNHAVFAFRRQRDGDVVVITVNVSATAQTYRDPESHADMTLAAWAWCIHTR